jgi:threonine synthase
MEPVGFMEAVMCGLAPDGGLLLPETLPDVRAELEDWRTMSYQELAFELIRRFATDLPEADLIELITESYADFRHPEVTPTVEVDGLHVLELFHGPTLAFKDVALQFLGRLFEYILQRRGGELNILGATSGDTGSAAIYGVRGRENIRIFVMHPKGRVSPVQERQMTSVLDDNVFNLAVEGTFDDCQHLMKNIFADVTFKKEHALGAVNSVNWARVLAQTVYYFYSAFRVMESTGAAAVQFSVPTGNFGDILAGWLAWKMGLPVRRLILATNENDILCRFFRDGDYSVSTVHPTLSPSMDIQVASNFERYLFYRLNADSAKLRDAMERFSREGALRVEPGPDGIDPVFRAGRGTTVDTLETIRTVRQATGYLIDPHTAVGVHVGRALCDPEVPLICLATAHPAKFTQAIEQATGETPHHELIDALMTAETRCETLPGEEAAIRRYLSKRTLKPLSRSLPE